MLICQLTFTQQVNSPVFRNLSAVRCSFANRGLLLKVVDLEDKTRELKYKSKWLIFCDKTGSLFYDKSDHLCDKSSKLRQKWLEIRQN